MKSTIEKTLEESSDGLSAFIEYRSGKPLVQPVVVQAAWLLLLLAMAVCVGEVIAARNFAERQVERASHARDEAAQELANATQELADAKATRQLADANLARAILLMNQAQAARQKQSDTMPRRDSREGPNAGQVSSL